MWTRQFRWIDGAAVLVVLGLLAAIAFPAIQAAREASQRSSCSNNLKVIALGIQNYDDVHRRFPFGTWQNTALPPEQRLSWIVGSSPFVLDGQVGYLFDFASPWNSPENLSAKIEHLAYRDGKDVWVESPMWEFTALQCPSRPFRKESGLSMTTYVGTAGLGRDGPWLSPSERGAGVWSYDHQIKSSDVKDGLSNTLMIVETSRDNGPWTAGGKPTLRSLLPSAAAIGGQFGGFHSTGCQGALMDGSVRFFEWSDARLFAAYFAVADSARPGRP